MDCPTSVPFFSAAAAASSTQPARSDSSAAAQPERLELLEEVALLHRARMSELLTDVLVDRRARVVNHKRRESVEVVSDAAKHGRHLVGPRNVLCS